MTPLFIAVDESHSLEATKALLKANADINLTIDGKNLKKEIINQFGKEILNFQPVDLDEAMKNLEVGNRTRLLRLLNESIIRDTCEEFEKELDQLGNAEDIMKSATGVYNLIQVASDMNLPKHLAAMLKINGKI